MTLIKSTSTRKSERLAWAEDSGRSLSATPGLFGWGRGTLPTMPPNGCFAAGTSISLSDGNAKSIEQISFFKGEAEPGDRIITLGGNSVCVVDLVHGPESLPLVYLTVHAYDLAGEKQELTVGLTEKHPVLVRYNYLVQANWLDVGDQVHTWYGPGIVIDVQRGVVTDDVWNLIMSGPEFLQAEGYVREDLRYAYASASLLGLSPRDHIIFANKIALATWPLQTQLAAALKNGTNLNVFS